MLLQELWGAGGRTVTGGIDYRHIYVDISGMQVAASKFTRAGRTCPGAMGYSFAAGTTDGEQQCLSRTRAVFVVL